MSFTKAQLIEIVRDQATVSPEWEIVAKQWSDEQISRLLVGIKSKKAALEAFEPTLKSLKAPKATAGNALKRSLEDRVIVEPAAEVRMPKEGTKRFKLVEALKKGATVDALMSVLGWNKDTVQAALRYDMKSLGFGVERKSGEYHLIEPK